mmetsp:Transcript_45116/g.72629  ORF Transcript_45116/g.72629 Transcript_45116/m.72629 type:complete len:205 (+) Transcript_45116:1977-2591(+)
MLLPTRNLIQHKIAVLQQLPLLGIVPSLRAMKEETRQQALALQQQAPVLQQTQQAQNRLRKRSTTRRKRLKFKKSITMHSYTTFLLLRQGGENTFFRMGTLISTILMFPIHSGSPPRSGGTRLLCLRVLGFQMHELRRQRRRQQQQQNQQQQVVKQGTWTQYHKTHRAKRRRAKTKRPKRAKQANSHLRLWRRVTRARFHKSTL